MPDTLVEEVTVVGTGEVIQPPTVDEIAARLRQAADNKVAIELTPGEARVLANFLRVSE